MKDYLANLSADELMEWYGVKADGIMLRARTNILSNALANELDSFGFNKGVEGAGYVLKSAAAVGANGTALGTVTDFTMETSSYSSAQIHSHFMSVRTMAYGFGRAYYGTD